MKIKFAQWRKHRKIFSMLGFILIIVLVFLYIKKDPILRYLYRHHYLSGAFDRIAKDGGHQPLLLNFDLSLRDMQFFDSFAQETSFEESQQQSVDLNMGDKNYTVSLSPFKSYFKKIQLNKSKPAFSIHFSSSSMLESNARQFDLFRIKNGDFFQQELVYDLGQRLGLFIPQTQYVNIYVNYVDYGDYTLKQSFDNLFLEHFNVPEAIIFMVDESRTGRTRIRILYDESKNRHIEDHLKRFTELMQAKDSYLLIKYFDLDYIARFEALRKLLQAKPGFVLHENLCFVYNKINGKIYPVLDESNLDNMLTQRKSNSFEFLNEQIQRHPTVKYYRNRFLFQLGSSYESIIRQHRSLFHKYRGQSGDLFYRLRLRLVAAYFNSAIYQRLHKYLPQRLLDAVEAGKTGQVKRLLESGAPITPLVQQMAQKKAKTKIINLLVQPYPAFNETVFNQKNQSPAYLDHIILSPHLFIQQNKTLGWRYLVHENIIVLAAGNYTLEQTQVVPLGCRIRIEAGVTLSMAPKVSLISFSPMDIMGTAKQPVMIKALNQEKPFGVVAIIGNERKETCTIQHLDFSGGNGAIIDGIKHSGGLNIYHLNVSIQNSSIHHNHTDSGLTIKESTVLVENNSLQNNFADQLTLDFCQGLLKGNRFTYNLSNNEADGVVVKGSELLFVRNHFEKLPDKGASIGKNSYAMFYDNVFSHNLFAIAARDEGRVLLLNNSFQNNCTVATAYRKRETQGGGTIYLIKNTLLNNKHLVQIDKFSQCFQLERKSEPSTLFMQLIGANKTVEIFNAFTLMRSRYQYKANRILSFTVGKTPGFIDEKNKLISVNLPVGATTLQPIQIRCLLPQTQTFILPTAYGNQIVPNSACFESEITPVAPYDFKAYIFRGQLNVQQDFQIDNYELIVTSGGLPIVEIDSSNPSGEIQKIKNEPKITCRIRFIRTAPPTSAQNSQSNVMDESDFNRYLEMNIEGRGHKWEKWKYGFTLEKRLALLGMPKSKRWVLESTYVEKSLMRPKIAFDLLDQFRERGQKHIAPQSRFVEVIVDGDYRGVYLLMEHIDQEFLGLDDFDKDESHNALLFRAKNKNANFSRYNNPADLLQEGYEDFSSGMQPRDKELDPFYGWGSGFEQRHPDPQKYGEYWGPVKELSKFIALASDEEFEKGIFEQLDINRYLELWIFSQLIDDSDGIYQNRYLVREKGKQAKWYFVPWDKDGILGRDSLMAKRSYAIWLHTNLFNRCMKIKWFREALKSTWDFYLAEGRISEKNIFKMIESNVTLLADAQKRNFLRWPADTQRGGYPDNNTFEQEIAYLKNWLHNRLQFLYNRIKNIHNPENLSTE